MTQGGEETTEPTERVLANDATTGADPTSFGDGHLARVRSLERLLATQRKWSVKSTRQLHATMLKDVQEAEVRALKAEKRAVAAERRLSRVKKRLETTEAELAEVRASATWKAGRAVVGLPVRVKRLRRR